MLHACAGSSNKSNSSAINISIWTCIFKHFITNFCENKNIKPLHAKVHSLRNRPTFRKCQNFTCLQRELQCGPLAQCPLHSGTLVRKFPGYIQSNEDTSYHTPGLWCSCRYLKKFHKLYFCLIFEFIAETLTTLQHNSPGCFRFILLGAQRRGRTE